MHHATRWAIFLFLWGFAPWAATAQTVIESIFTAAQSTAYDDPNNWSPAEVPNNSANRIYNVTIPGHVEVNLTATVSNLQGNEILINGGSSLTISNSATILSGLTLVNGGAFQVIGNLTNFDAASRTLVNGNFFLGSFQPGGGTSSLRFPGADIVNNAASLAISGTPVEIVDENGMPALRNFAKNATTGTFALSDADFATTGDFTNDGELRIVGGTFSVAGSLTNFNPATRTISGGRYFLDFGGMLKFAGADIVGNAAYIYLGRSTQITDELGRDGLRNFSENQAAGCLLVGTGKNLFLSSDFTNLGKVFVGSVDASDASLVLAAPARYRQLAGETELAGGVIFGDVQIDGGTLKSSGTFDNGGSGISGDLTINDGVLSLGELTVGRSVQLNAQSRFRLSSPMFQSYRQLPAALVVEPFLDGLGEGRVVLGGTIEIDYDGFPLARDASFVAIQCSDLGGAFDNAPEGARVLTIDGRASFRVTYQTDKVILSEYERIPPAAQLLNISTRARVLTGDNVTIGGFIVGGQAPKRVIVRGIGPSLAERNVLDALQDPVITLHDRGGSVIATNNDWRDSQAEEIQMSGLAPENDREAAIIANLPGGAYTVVLRGNNETTGVGLIEVYDLASATLQKLANLSTRGFVDSENPLIGGFIAGGSGNGAAEITVRAIGPGLRFRGVSNFLPDPTLEVRDRDGTLVAANDDHANIPLPEGLRPTEIQDAALNLVQPRGEYTVIVRGKDNASGVALVEAYDLNR